MTETAVFVTPALIRLDNSHIRRIVCDPEIFEIEDRRIGLIPQATMLYSPRYTLNARAELEGALSSFRFTADEVDHFFPYIDRKYRWLIHFFQEANIPAAKIAYGICDCISPDEIRLLLEENRQERASWYHLRCSASCSSFDRKVNDYYLNGDHPIQDQTPQILHS